MQSISVGEAKSRFSSHNRQHFERVPALRSRIGWSREGRPPQFARGSMPPVAGQRTSTVTGLEVRPGSTLRRTW